MNRVAEIRKALGKTQEQFAEFCGVSRASIARYEKGDNINPDNAARIAEACNVSIGYLLGDSGPVEMVLPQLFRLSQDEIDLVTNFRNLSSDQRRSIINLIASMLPPENANKVSSGKIVL